MTDRLVLGTAQLRMPYGINNKVGTPDPGIAREIITTALDQGITRFDTSPAYGDSESILGGLFDDLKINTKVKVYSKLDPKLDLGDESAVERSVDDSLRKLKVDRLEGLLLHHEDGLGYWDEGLGDVMRGLVSKGKVKSVGSSFYSPQNAFDALDAEGIDIIQVPANILDRRFEKIGVFDKAKERNIDVFVRSVFLQGLLLMDLDSIPDPMRYALPYLQALERLARIIGVSRKEIVFRWAATRWPGSLTLFGAEKSEQIIEDVGAFSASLPITHDDRLFDSVPELVVNPTLWPRL